MNAWFFSLFDDPAGEGEGKPLGKGETKMKRERERERRGRFSLPFSSCTPVWGVGWGGRVSQTSDDTTITNDDADDDDDDDDDESSGFQANKKITAAARMKPDDV